MAETAFLSSIDQGSQRLLTKLKALPASTWRAVVIAIALIWVCHSLAQLVWIVFSAPQLPAPKVLAMPSTSESSVQNYKVDLSVLQAAQIFGDGVEGELAEEATAVVQSNVDEDVEKTKLNLKLAGVVASTDQAASSAVISTGSQQHIYQVDDKLPAGTNVTLAKVLSDRVILNNNGNFEALWLYTDADFKVNYAYSNSGKDEAESDKNRASQDTIRTKLRPSQVPKNLSEVVRFSVHREEGQMVGFRIRPGKKRELFQQMGLRANDVVTSVNGIPIDSPQAIRDNYQQLKTATSADLEVQRGEETLYINVSIDSETSE